MIQRMKASISFKWAVRILYVLVFISLTADFWANDRPLFARLDGETRFPVLEQYAYQVGRGRNPRIDWYSQDYQWVLWPPVPYAAGTIDRKNLGAHSPLEVQNLSTPRFRHWLGTDTLGRDVLAGLLLGLRKALLIGLVAMGLAALIGISLGSLAGFFGDDRLKTSRLRIWINLFALLPAYYLAFVYRSYALQFGAFGVEFLKSVGIFIGFFLLLNFLLSKLERRFRLARKVIIPIDLLVMRLIEVVNSIPALLLILAMLALIRRPGIIHIMLVIGFIQWTGIARFVRAELLKVRTMEYIEAARALGLKECRILWRHALPNSLRPVYIQLAFGMAGAILLEANLSFLGLGAIGEVTWGSLLYQVISMPKAWWLALFPGLAIFLTVLIFNLIGDGLSGEN